MDRILIRLPNDLQYVLPAISVVQSYVTHVTQQARDGKRDPSIGMRVEVQKEEHLFLTPMLDRLDWWVNGGEKYYRADWDCVLDFRDVHRAFTMALPSKKHLVEVWSAMVGANAKWIPYMGYLLMRWEAPDTDVLVDGSVSPKLVDFLNINYPELVVRRERVNWLRTCQVFATMMRTKMYIGPRSEASYMAAAMNKVLLELYPDDMPLHLLEKPACNFYRVIYGRDFSPERIWCEVTELCQVIRPLRSPVGLVSGDRQVSIVESVAAR